MTSDVALGLVASGYVVNLAIKDMVQIDFDQIAR